MRDGKITTTGSVLVLSHSNNRVEIVIEMGYENHSAMWGGVFVGYGIVFRFFVHDDFKPPRNTVTVILRVDLWRSIAIVPVTMNMLIRHT